MALATWWTSDPLPSLAPRSGFSASLATDDEILARLNRISLLEIRERRQRGHRPYIGYANGVPATYGWVATQEASIGELRTTFRLPPEDRYLWDFATLPEWQGRGLYPRLLQTIMREEARTAQRLWIIYAPENTPSGAGMQKAGFVPVGLLSFRADGGVVLAPLGDGRRAPVGAALLGVPLAETVLAPCWSCNGTVERAISKVDIAACWPPRPPLSTACTCAIATKPSVEVSNS